jgi:hypothetical protein
MKNVIIDGVEYAPVIKQKAQIVNKHYHFELHPYNLGEMNWDEAVKAVKKLRNGWRLPTIEECFMIYEDELINDKLCWSSTEDVSNDAWIFNFYTGYAFNKAKHNSWYVRAVRDL